MKPFLALLAGLLLAGCASLSSKNLLTERDDGRTIHLAVGQSVMIKLACNPSTGYAWTEQKVAKPVLEATGPATYTQDFAPQGTVGVGGTALVEYKAVKAGQQVLQFVYARAWEKDTPPAKTISFNVSVSP